MTTVVYVLKCNNEKYYVGKTRRNVNTRFQEHRDGFGSEWTRKYRPIRIIESSVQATNNFLELTKTLEYMEKYGVENVRGGPYCQVDLPEIIKDVINRQLSYDSCYKCGNRGHFADECDDQDSSSYSSDERDDYNDSFDEHDNYYNDHGGPSNFVNKHNGYRSCYNCGSPSHLANECEK